MRRLLETIIAAGEGRRRERAREERKILYRTATKG